MVELYFHTPPPPIRLHGVELNKLRPGTTLPLILSRITFKRSVCVEREVIGLVSQKPALLKCFKISGTGTDLGMQI
jgi:hypothetical protein